MLTLLGHSLVPLHNDPKHNKSNISNMLNAKLFMSLCTSMCVCVCGCVCLCYGPQAGLADLSESEPHDRRSGIVSVPRLLWSQPVCRPPALLAYNC